MMAPQFLASSGAFFGGAGITPRKRSVLRSILGILVLALSLVTGDETGSAAVSQGGASPDAPSEKKPAVEVEAITFAANPGRFYLPVEEAAELLGWPVEHDEENERITLNEITLRYRELRHLVEGPRLVHMTHLIARGAVVEKSEDGNEVTVTHGKKRVRLVAAAKRVRVDLTTQRLRAWQGRRKVLDSHISSGRYGTPTGNFKAGPYKSRMHYSRLFNNAPMPYSVQFHGHYFIHGFKTVPDYPASHGCIRMHLDQGNPAGFFYDWVDVGTPIEIYRSEKKKEPKTG